MNPQNEQQNLTQQQPNIQTPLNQKVDHTNRDALLWIFSPFITLISVAVISIIFRLIFTTTPIILNLFLWLVGVIGVLLFFIGPTVGVVLLVRKK